MGKHRIESPYGLVTIINWWPVLNHAYDIFDFQNVSSARERDSDETVRHNAFHCCPDILWLRLRLPRTRHHRHHLPDVPPPHSSLYIVLTLLSSPLLSSWSCVPIHRIVIPQTNCDHGLNSPGTVDIHKWRLTTMMTVPYLTAS
jgi:hypothetical protein